MPADRAAVSVLRRARPQRAGAARRRASEPSERAGQLSAVAARARSAELPWWLIGPLLVGGAIRFATLGHQSYWEDEVQAWSILHAPLGSIVSELRATQSTPPLYFWIAWFWVRVFGYGEVALRSLSAVFGTATIPVVALIARRLRGDRAAFAAGAFVAASPVLVWYSQEARAYSLFALLCAISLGCMLSLRSTPTAARAAAWTVVSVLAIATHYFAGFVVIAEACVLVAWPGRLFPRRMLIAPLAVLATVAVPLGILAHEQYPNSVVVEHLGLGHQLVQSAGQLLVGYGVDPVMITCGVLSAAGLAVCVWAFLRRPRLVGGDFWPLVSVTALSVLGPIVVGLAGSQLIDTRNLLYVLVLVAVIAAVGTEWAKPRWAFALPLAAGLAVVIHVYFDPTLQRTDNRGVARAIGGPSAPRAVLIRTQGFAYLSPYISELRPIGPRGVRVAEIVFVGMTMGGGLNRQVEPLSGLRFTAPAGFTQVAARTTSTYTLRRFRAAQPTLVTALELESRAGGDVQVLLAP